MLDNSGRLWKTARGFAAEIPNSGNHSAGIRPSKSLSALDASSYKSNATCRESKHWSRLNGALVGTGVGVVAWWLFRKVEPFESATEGDFLTFRIPLGLPWGLGAGRSP